MPRQMRGMFFVRPQIVVQGNPEGIPQFGLVAEEVEKGERGVAQRSPQRASTSPRAGSHHQAAEIFCCAAEKGNGNPRNESQEQVSQIQDVSDQLERVSMSMMDRRL
jgi:hypothetical protein